MELLSIESIYFVPTSKIHFIIKYGSTYHCTSTVVSLSTAENNDQKVAS